MPSVPNQPKTPMRAFRLDDNLWSELRAAAKERGISASALLRVLVEEYLEKRRRR